MCHRLVLVVSTQMIRPRRSRGLSRDRRWCCCLVSRLGRRIPLLRVTSRVSMNPLLRRLHRHRFLVCLSLREMQRKYAKEIRAAKLEEFKSYLDNDAIRLTDRRRLNRDVNFLTGRWVLTVKVDKNGYFSKFKARWVCRGFQDKFAWDQQTDSPTATRYGFRLVAQCAANQIWDLFHLDLKTAFLQGEHYNLSSRMVVVQLPQDIGLPTWMVGLCLRPAYGLNDAPRRWWNRLDKFLRSVGMEPTRADRCTYVAYDGIEGKKEQELPFGRKLLSRGGT